MHILLLLLAILSKDHGYCQLVTCWTLRWQGSKSKLQFFSLHQTHLKLQVPLQPPQVSLVSPISSNLISVELHTTYPLLIQVRCLRVWNDATKTTQLIQLMLALTTSTASNELPQLLTETKKDEKNVFLNYLNINYTLNIKGFWGFGDIKYNNNRNI